MLTGDLRNKVDQIWNAFWSGGIANPIEVIEQITYLCITYPDMLRVPAQNAHFHSGMFHGYDFDNTMLRIGSMNMLLHGVEHPAIEYRDSLAETHAEDAGAYSLILANPPFAGSLDHESTAKDLQQTVKTKKTELLFLALFLRLLKTGGRAAVIVPDGVLFGSSRAYKDPVTNPKGWDMSTIGDLAEVQGGLQVTSARKNLPLEVPYLRVANVYRGMLDLSEIKTIRATPAEVQRTTLMNNDLLVVEGHGNPNEIGRAALCNGNTEQCVHQNHLIRARFRRTKVEPIFASEYVNSPGGRQHLLRAGKSTSGLNTISVSNVRETPVALPPSPSNKPSPLASRLSKPSKLPTAAPWPRRVRCLPRCSSGRLPEPCK